jgi:hypothetical protein
MRDPSVQLAAPAVGSGSGAAFDQLPDATSYT